MSDRLPPIPCRVPGCKATAERGESLCRRCEGRLPDVEWTRLQQAWRAYRAAVAVREQAAATAALDHLRTQQDRCVDLVVRSLNGEPVLPPGRPARQERLL